MGWVKRPVLTSLSLAIMLWGCLSVAGALDGIKEYFSKDENKEGGKLDWIQTITIAGSTIGCYYFFRRETNAELKEMKKDSREFREEMKGFHQEMKSFHGRLCTLEERYLQTMQRLLEKKEN